MKPEGWRNKRPDDSWAHSEAAHGRKTRGVSSSVAKPIYPKMTKRMNEKMKKYQSLADFITEKYSVPKVTVVPMSNIDKVAPWIEKEKRELLMKSDYGQVVTYPYAEQPFSEIHITPKTSLFVFLHEMAHYIFNTSDEKLADDYARELKTTTYQTWINEKKRNKKQSFR
jgi:hypothetical protein